MNPPHTLHASTFVDLAASGVGTKVIAFVVGLIVVLLLLGGFWYGARLRSRMAPVPRPEDQPKKPDHQTHLEENVDSSDRFPGHGERLYPYQLGGHGAEAYRPPDEDDTTDRGEQQGGATRAPDDPPRT